MVGQFFHIKLLVFILITYHDGEKPIFNKIRSSMKVLHFVFHYILRHYLLLVMHNMNLYSCLNQDILIMVVFYIYFNMGVGVIKACVTMGTNPLGLGFKSLSSFLFASVCINMFREKHQRPRVEIVLNHVYSVVAIQAKEFIFMNFNLFVKMY